MKSSSEATELLAPPDVAEPRPATRDITELLNEDAQPVQSGIDLIRDRARDLIDPED